MSTDADLPICRLIKSRMTELGVTEWNLAQACGYRSVPGGLKAIRSTLETGCIHPFLAPSLATALGVDQGTYARALAETAWVLEAKAAHKRQERETRYRMEFGPYLWATFRGACPIPNAIAVLAGIYSATVVPLPSSLAVTRRQIETVTEAARAHFGRWPSGMPFYGPITGYLEAIEPGTEPGTDVVIPRGVDGLVLGTARSVQRPQFLLTKTPGDPLSNWINDLDQRRRSRF